MSWLSRNHRSATLPDRSRSTPCCPAFEVLAVGLPVQREEVVPVEDHVGARVLGLSDGATDLGIVSVLRLQLDGDPDRVGHGSIMAHMEQTGPRTALLRGPEAIEHLAGYFETTPLVDTRASSRVNESASSRVGYRGNVTGAVPRETR